MIEEPEHLYALAPADPQDQVVRALNRIATALEQLVLERAVQPAAQPALAPLPTMQPPVNQVIATCPTHNQPWKLVPAGVSKKTGQPYNAFLACPVRGCDQRPPQ